MGRSHAYKRAQGSFTAKGAFILAKLAERDGAKLETVLHDLYREARPEPAGHYTKFQWQVILRYMGASEDEIADVQKRMGRVWR